MNHQNATDVPASASFYQRQADTARRRPPLWSLARLDDSRWTVAVWWYFCLLCTAVVWKYFNTAWGDALHPVALPHRSLLAPAIPAMSAALRLVSVYRADMIQCAVTVAALTALGSVLGRPRLARLAWIVTSAGVVIAAAEWVALHQTGMPLTYDNLLVSVDWAREHPQVIPTVMPWTYIVFIALAALTWGGVPWAMTALRRRHGVGRFASVLSTALGFLAATLIAVALLAPGPLAPSWSQTLSPTEGFWSSSAAALANVDRESPRNLPVETRSALSAEYQKLVFPGGLGSAGKLPVSLGAVVPRHVVLVVLETAPRKYYPLDSDTSYHTFHSLLPAAIVSKNHFTPRPYTLFAIYSMITGTYPRPGAPIGEYGHFRNDGLASVLRGRGFETAYIDSYRVDWGYHYRAELQQEGFESILDTAGFRAPAARDPYAVAVARERWSLSQGLRSIAAAQSQHKKAFVVVATTLGHFPWRAPVGSEADPAPVKLHRIGLALDSAVGDFLGGLDSLGLRDSTIVVITGDHGLRYSAEFASFGFSGRPDDVDFNVPFILYAPGLIKRAVESPNATSHVDIAPTLYSLLGIPADSMLLDGESMLNKALSDRVVFLMNTGIYPVDGFVYEGHRYSWNEITDAVHVTPSFGDRTGDSLARRVNTKATLSQANHIFNLTAAYFLHQGERATPNLQ